MRQWRTIAYPLTAFLIVEGTLPQRLFQGCSSSKAPSVTVGRLEAAAKIPKEVEKSSIDRETSLGDELACGFPGSTARASQQPMLPAPPNMQHTATGQLIQQSSALL
ncbi:uncharacterized protein [Dermacentor albipictus]|uniref:uncharacterized protein isoform X2 n=1 Tax=Dermacentor albipictus TaxID=60249 RepID=UPI0038FC3646